MKPSPLCRCVAARGLIGTCRRMKSGSPPSEGPVNLSEEIGPWSPADGRDRMDGVVRGEVPRRARRMVGLVDDDCGRWREGRRPGRLGRSRPGPVAPHAGYRTGRMPRRPRSVRSERGRRWSPGSSGRRRRPPRGCTNDSSEPPSFQARLRKSVMAGHSPGARGGVTSSRDQRSGGPCQLFPENGDGIVKDDG